uniref:Transmembrane protein n=1 Tax=Chromera velia CCMP2878 TaxID=1169474 RepID=A0A0G4GBI2_9ALVE|eukprot:Cvel_21147.t1-p1 / transcript=Cvel_21147.t1 / gene=Cvel_21147 / organism=Chromera_velia_CCMP2878 / gene_product=hypothetical protein / transcript_product=hypothetical protein / location=Cvel_scaffold1960:28707-29972(+) / protein_length=422 / sequence_SO=supercontig / SO=protein_coding / is_pseudo=false
MSLRTSFISIAFWQIAVAIFSALESVKHFPLEPFGGFFIFSSGVISGVAASLTFSGVMKDGTAVMRMHFGTLSYGAAALLSTVLCLDLSGKTAAVSPSPPGGNRLTFTSGLFILPMAAGNVYFALVSAYFLLANQQQHQQKPHGDKPSKGSLRDRYLSVQSYGSNACYHRGSRGSRGSSVSSRRRSWMLQERRERKESFLRSHERRVSIGRAGPWKKRGKENQRERGGGRDRSRMGQRHLQRQREEPRGFRQQQRGGGVRLNRGFSNELSEEEEEEGDESQEESDSSLQDGGGKTGRAHGQRGRGWDARGNQQRSSAVGTTRELPPQIRGLSLSFEEEEEEEEEGRGREREGDRDIEEGFPVPPSDGKVAWGFDGCDSGEEDDGSEGESYEGNEGGAEKLRGDHAGSTQPVMEQSAEGDAAV